MITSAILIISMTDMTIIITVVEPWTTEKETDGATCRPAVARATGVMVDGDLSVPSDRRAEHEGLALERATVET